MSEPTYGEHVRVQCGAIGRYLDYGLALVVSAEDGGVLFVDVFIERVGPEGASAKDRRLPGWSEMSGAITALRYAGVFRRHFDADRGVSS